MLPSKKQIKSAWDRYTTVFTSDVPEDKKLGWWTIGLGLATALGLLFSWGDTFTQLLLVVFLLKILVDAAATEK